MIEFDLYLLIFPKNHVKDYDGKDIYLLQAYQFR